MKPNKVFLILLLTVILFAMGGATMSSAQTRTTSARRPAATRTTTTKPKAPTQQKRTTAQHRTTQQQRNAQLQRARRQQQARIDAQYKEVSFTITGKAHDFPEGEWVRLCEPGAKGLQTIDSVKLNGEDFSFKGKTLSIPKMAFIVMGEGAKKTLVELFLEEGNIKVDITAAMRVDKVSGTPNNNIYSPYRDSINLVYTDLYNCIRESYKPSTSKDDREAYQLGADSMRQRLVSVTYDFAAKNLNNWVGLYLFAEYYKRFTLQQDKHLLTLVPKKYTTLPIITEIRKYCK